MSNLIQPIPYQVQRKGQFFLIRNQRKSVCLRAGRKHIQDLKIVKQNLLQKQKKPQEQTETETEKDFLDQLGDPEAVQIELDQVAEQDWEVGEDDNDDSELLEFLERYSNNNSNNPGKQGYIFEGSIEEDDDDLKSLESQISEEDMLQVYNQAAEKVGVPQVEDEQQLANLLSQTGEHQIGLMDSDWTVNQIDDEPPLSGPQRNEEALQMSSSELMFSDKTIFDTDSMLAKISPKILKEMEKEKPKKQQRLGSSAGGQNFKVQKVLRIINGQFGGKKLFSPQYNVNVTRPMMERVRGAMFDMIASMYGQQLPSTSRWLDLYAGTGSVGLEALSRGCGEARFVESDPQVTRKCLKANIQACGVEEMAFIHPTRVEEFLKQNIETGGYGGGKFDFVSVCPPYLLVSYPELFDLFSAASILHDNSLVFIEYPKNLSDQLRDTLGPLYRIKDKNYGRTQLAVYGPQQ